MKDLESALKSAKPEVKAFAFQLLQRAYVSMPDELVFPGGQVVPNAGITLKGRVSGLIQALPGGSDFVKQLPRRTTAYARSGRDADLYRYSGTFTPNKRVVGTWHWAVWPRPKTKQEVPKAAASWAARQKTNEEKPKDVLQIMDGGAVKSRGFSGHFWSGNMLIGINNGIARRMAVHPFGGVDFLIIETGGFEKGKIPKDWNQQYTIYMRAK